MGFKITHFTFSGSKEHRIGGIGKGLLGAQPLALPRPNTWYPRNPSIASNGTPQDSDVKTLLTSLQPLVAYLTVIQSVVLSSCYRTVQNGIAPGGTFTYGGVTAAGVGTFFDANQVIAESIAVDVVNKNPALVYDLALRLAAQTATYIDMLALANYASWTKATQGAANTTPTYANLQAAVPLLPQTGEPIIGIFSDSTLLALKQAKIIGKDDLTVIAAINGGARPFRSYACDAIPVTGTGNPTTHNQMVVPSAWCVASTDMGTATNQVGNTNIISGIPGNIQKVASSYLDPDSANPQLVLQLVMGNSGAGQQTVYVNGLLTPLILNPAGGVQVLS